MIIEKKKKSVKNNASISNEIKLANGTYIPVGAVVWKPGHVGNYVGNQTVVEARSEFVDVEVNPIGSRDFTYCLLLPGIQYRVYQGDGAVEDSDSDSESYTSWIGKIVNSISPRVPDGCQLVPVRQKLQSSQLIQFHQ